MKEEINLLLNNKTIKKIIVEKFGDLAVDVIKKLIEHGEAIDLMLASELKVEANVLRATLYKLYEQRVVDFRGERKKDVAWIDYIWWLREKDFIEFLKKEIEKRKEYYFNLVENIMLTEYFYCPKCKSIYNYDLAIKLDFVCPKDKVELSYLDNKEILLEEYKREIKGLEEALSLVKSIEVKAKAKAR